MTSLSATSRGRNTTTGTVKKRSPYLSRNYTPPTGDKDNMATDSETDHRSATGSARRHGKQPQDPSSHRSRHHSSSKEKDQPRLKSPSLSSVASASGHRKENGKAARKEQCAASPPLQQHSTRPSPLVPAAVPLPPSSFRQSPPLPSSSRRNVPEINVQPPTMPQRSEPSSVSPRHRSSNHGERHRHRRHHHRHHHSRSSTTPRPRSPQVAAPSAPAPAAEAGPSTRDLNTSPFHAGLQDILQGVFGHGARGPTEPEMRKLADDLGGLIEGALLDRLVAELRAGLLERLLVEYVPGGAGGGGDGQGVRAGEQEEARQTR
ncbi:hypothetical protein PG985_007604 [Apiospora marii]